MHGGEHRDEHVHEAHTQHATRARGSVPSEPGYPPPADAGPEHARAGDHAAHDKHAGHSITMFRDRFWISLALSLPTIAWGHMLPAALGWHPPSVPGARWIPPLFGTLVFGYGGLPFLAGALRELRARLPGMMTLIALAITVAFGFSAAVTLGFPGAPLWEELATLVTIMLLGHWIEMRSISQAQGALGELAKLLQSRATRLSLDVSGAERSEEVTVSRPVRKLPGQRVIAGTVNGTGALTVRVTGTGDATALARIMRLVAQAQTSRSRAQALADRAAFWLTLVALGAGGLTLATWLAVRAEPAYAIERLVTVLVIACPHALGLAVPLVVLCFFLEGRLQSLALAIVGGGIRLQECSVRVELRRQQVRHWQHA